MNICDSEQVKKIGGKCSGNGAASSASLSGKAA
jgi:hypothetical protein